jgi:hypothetical protein
VRLWRPSPPALWGRDVPVCLVRVPGRGGMAFVGRVRQVGRTGSITPTATPPPLVCAGRSAACGASANGFHFGGQVG